MPLSLYDEALVAFAAGGTVMFDGRPVHLLVLECAKDYYTLLVVGLVDGTLYADPGVTLARLYFPDPRVTFSVEQSNKAIVCTVKLTHSFTLTFAVDHEFWEVARIISEAMGEDAVEQKRLVELIDAAYIHLPTAYMALPPAYVQPSAAPAIAPEIDSATLEAPPPIDTSDETQNAADTAQENLDVGNRVVALTNTAQEGPAHTADLANHAQEGLASAGDGGSTEALVKAANTAEKDLVDVGNGVVALTNAAQEGPAHTADLANHAQEGLASAGDGGSTEALVKAANTAEKDLVDVGNGVVALTNTAQEDLTNAGDGGLTEALVDAADTAQKDLVDVGSGVVALESAAQEDPVKVEASDSIVVEEGPANSAGALNGAEEKIGDEAY